VGATLLSLHDKAAAHRVADRIVDLAEAPSRSQMAQISQIPLVASAPSAESATEGGKR
jgi:hypothetical protein